MRTTSTSHRSAPSMLGGLHREAEHVGLVQRLFEGLQPLGPAQWLTERHVPAQQPGEHLEELLEIGVPIAHR